MLVINILSDQAKPVLSSVGFSQSSESHSSRWDSSLSGQPLQAWQSSLGSPAQLHVLPWMHSMRPGRRWISECYRYPNHPEHMRLQNYLIDTQPIRGLRVRRVLWSKDADQACRLLLSGLALALLDTCEVEELKPGIYAYLAACRGKFWNILLMLVDFNRTSADFRNINLKW